MTISKVGRRGQTTIPKEIREQIGVREGDRIAFLHRDDDIVLVPLTMALTDLRGSVPVTEEQDFEQIRRHVFRQRAQKAGKHET